MVEATRLWHVVAYDGEGEYVCGSEFSCGDAQEARGWFEEEFAEELDGTETIEAKHVGYTIYEGDDCIDLYI